MIIMMVKVPIVAVAAAALLALFCVCAAKVEIMDENRWDEETLRELRALRDGKNAQINTVGEARHVQRRLGTCDKCMDESWTATDPSDYCYESNKPAYYSCAVCGFYSDGDDAGSAFDCVTCLYGQEIDVVFSDCTGYCVSAGNATTNYDDAEGNTCVSQCADCTYKGVEYWNPAETFNMTDLPEEINAAPAGLYSGGSSTTLLANLVILFASVFVVP